MRSSILAASVAIIAGLPAWAAAQIKLPVFEDAKERYQNVAFQETTEPADYRHGKLVRLTLKDSATPIKGVLVRTDASKGLIYVRTQPGSPPRAVAVNDIKRIEKGVIKEAAFRKDLATPEIQVLEVYNGGKRTVSYNAPTLSSGEIAQLGDLEIAQNDMARLEYTVRAENQALENNAAIWADRRQTLELTNKLLDQRLALNQSNVNDYVRGPNNLLPFTASGPMSTSAEFAELLLAGLAPFPMARVTPAALPNPAVASEALAAARRRYLAARSHAVYENGHLVAVIQEEPAERTSK